ITEAKPTVWFVPGILALVTVVLGIVPSLLNWAVGQAAIATTTDAHEPHLSIWHGFNIPLALTGIIIAFGIILVNFNRELARAMTNFGAPISGLSAVEKIRTGIIDFGAKYATKPSGTTSMRRHLVVPLLMLILITFVGLFALRDLPEVHRETSTPTDWVFVLIIGIGVLASVMAKSRLTVVVVVSIAGVAVLLCSGLGAAPLAGSLHSGNPQIPLVVHRLVRSRRRKRHPCGMGTYGPSGQVRCRAPVFGTSTKRYWWFQYREHDLG